MNVVPVVPVYSTSTMCFFCVVDPFATAGVLTFSGYTTTGRPRGLVVL